MILNNPRKKRKERIHMLEKISLILVILTISTLVLAQGVIAFAPANANFVATFKNNGQNYSALKKVPIFSFLLDDLGIESLIKSSVSQTALSINVRTSQIWDALQNNFVIFGKGKATMNPEITKTSVAIVLKSNSNIVTKLLYALVGGTVGTKKIDNTTFKTFTTSGVTIYILNHGSYVLLSNSPELILSAINSYDGKVPSFKTFGNVPSNAWFSLYFQGGFSETSTSDVIPKDAFVYGKIDGNSLSITGVTAFEYRDKTLESKILSFKPNVKTLESVPATGDFWAAADVADPVGIYKIVKKYVKGLEKGKVAEEEALDLVKHTNGKLFMNMNVSSNKEEYVASIYLSKSLSKYIPSISKGASATFMWKGHTVLRDDTIEGTKTISDYTIFYPDKVVFSNMPPENASKYLEAHSMAKDMGNFSSFSNQTWNNAFLLGYINVGKIIESALQYTISSGAILQAKINNKADLVWQLILR